MALRMSRVETATSNLQSVAHDADDNHDGRVTSQELKAALDQASDAEKSAAFAIWRDAYDLHHHSPTSGQMAERALLAGQELQQADLNGNRILTLAELSAPLTKTTARVATYAHQVKAPPVMTPAQIKNATREALANSLGVTTPVRVGSHRFVNGQPVVRIPVGDGEAELTLKQSQTGPWEAVDAQLLSPPNVLDPALRLRFETLLQSDFGYVHPSVQAYGQVSEMNGVTTWQIQFEHGVPGQRTQKQLQLELSPNGATPTPYVFDLGAAKQQALQLATEASDTLCGGFQAPFNRLGRVEVFLKREPLGPSDISPVQPDDSPIGFDPAREVQLQVPPLVGDNAGFVTLDRTSGVARAETFN